MSDDIPKSVLEHFANVREISGISISNQIRMYNDGYRIAKANDGGFDGGIDVQLKCKKHELLEYTGEDDFSLVGNIITKEGKFCSAEVIGSIVTTIYDISMIRAFLDKVEDTINE